MNLRFLEFIHIFTSISIAKPFLHALNLLSRSSHFVLLLHTKIFLFRVARKNPNRRKFKCAPSNIIPSSNGRGEYIRILMYRKRTLYIVHDCLCLHVCCVTVPSSAHTNFIPFFLSERYSFSAFFLLLSLCSITSFHAAADPHCHFFPGLVASVRMCFVVLCAKE